jgi:hypothetical protein
MRLRPPPADRASAYGWSLDRQSPRQSLKPRRLQFQVMHSLIAKSFVPEMARDQGGGPGRLGDGHAAADGADGVVRAALAGEQVVGVVEQRLGVLSRRGCLVEQRQRLGDQRRARAPGLRTPPSSEDRSQGSNAGCCRGTTDHRHRPTPSRVGRRVLTGPSAAACEKRRTENSSARAVLIRWYRGRLVRQGDHLPGAASQGTAGPQASLAPARRATSPSHPARSTGPSPIAGRVAAVKMMWRPCGDEPGCPGPPQEPAIAAATISRA